MLTKSLQSVYLPCVESRIGFPNLGNAGCFHVIPLLSRIGFGLLSSWISFQ